jgi:AraC-like DNA-binding protein
MQHETALMRGVQRIKADLSGSAEGEQMFDNVRELSFDDRENGWLETAVAKLGSSQIGLWRVRSTGHRISVGVPARDTMLLPLSGSISVDTIGGEINANAGEALMIGAGPRKTRTISRARKPYDALALMFPPGLVGEAALGRRGFTLSGRGGLASYVRYLAVEAQARDGVLSRPAAQHAAAAMLAEYLATLIDTRQDARAVRVAASLRQLNRAEEILRATFQEPLTILEVAQQVGVSTRSLQHAFRVHRNAGPMEMLARIRLENARLRLLNAEPLDTVSGIALDCGFSHLGRFSIFYRESYGETPSDTLKRNNRQIRWAG